MLKAGLASILVLLSLYTGCQGFKENEFKVRMYGVTRNLQGLRPPAGSRHSEYFWQTYECGPFGTAD